MVAPIMLDDNQFPFDQAASDLGKLLHADRPLFPEFERVRNHLDTLLKAPHAQTMLAEADSLLVDVGTIPQTTYSQFQAFTIRGDREPYQTPYFLKRQRLDALVLRFFSGRGELRDAIQNYLWDICEESTWVLPAHARYRPYGSRNGPGVGGNCLLTW